MSADAAIGFVFGAAWAGVFACLIARFRRAVGQAQATPETTQALSMSPGDCLVLTYSHFLTPEQRTRLREKIEFDLGGLARVVVLEGGIRVDSVLKK